MIPLFLRETYDHDQYFINTKGRNDLVIHNAKNTVGVILETKKPTNKSEMLTVENINTNILPISEENFSDQDQIRLKLFCDKITANGHYFILSNSDVKNFDDKNNFFDEVYQADNIKRVKAKRSINSKGDQRGEIFELLINNF